jgi:hypothetical protein
MVTNVLPSCMFGPRLNLAPRSALSCHPERSEGSAFRLSTLHALSVSAFNSSDVCPFNFKLSTACPERSRRVNFLQLTPFPATLTSHLQLAENKTTLSLAVATLTSRVKHKSFVCHSYEKHPGWGVCRRQFLRGKDFSLCSFETACLGEIRSEGSAGIEESRPPSSHHSRIASHRSGPLSFTSHESQVTKPCRIRTYRKRGRGAPIFFQAKNLRCVRERCRYLLISLLHYLATSLPPLSLHGTNAPLARLHRCRGELHA